MGDRLRAWERFIVKLLTSALLSVTLAWSGTAWATDPPPRYGATRQARPAVPARPAAERLDPATAATDKIDPARPDTEASRKKPKRRAVYQQFDDIPTRLEPSAVYAPKLSPRIDPTPVPPPTTLNCVGAACTDASGGSYRGGVGTSLISPQGRICNNNGITVQCY